MTMIVVAEAVGEVTGTTTIGETEVGVTDTRTIEVEAGEGMEETVEVGVVEGMEVMEIGTRRSEEKEITKTITMERAKTTTLTTMG